jgi:hypothetical protein
MKQYTLAPLPPGVFSTLVAATLDAATLDAATPDAAAPDAPASLLRLWAAAGRVPPSRPINRAAAISGRGWRLMAQGMAIQLRRCRSTVSIQIPLSRS